MTVQLPPPPIIWIVTEGLKGTENQCLGIANAFAKLTPAQTVIKRITLHQPWKLLSPYLGFECSKTFSEPLHPPWPDILISSGRKSIAASRYIKKKSKGKTLTVQVQDPRINPARFDVVVVPRHDPTRGKNVIVTMATPNIINLSLLDEAKTEFAPLFENIGCPRVAVLIGGSTKTHRFTLDDTRNLVARLSPLKNMMITTSRRTGNDNTKLLREKLAPHYFYDDQFPNPYLGMLAWADVILVTADSTSMISDAATTGKPVYIIPMKGLSNRQIKLVNHLKESGAVRDFDGKLESWAYPPLNDASFIAEEILKLYKSHRKEENNDRELKFHDQ